MTVNQVSELMAGGRFKEALRALEHGAVPAVDRRAAAVRTAGLYEGLGDSARARMLADAVTRSKPLPPALRSTCEFVLALIDFEERTISSAISRLQRSIEIALRERLMERAFWPRLRLFITLADHSGPDAAGALLAPLRPAALTLGSPRAAAALHIGLGASAEQRGPLSNAHKRITLE